MLQVKKGITVAESIGYLEKYAHQPDPSTITMFPLPLHTRNRFCRLYRKAAKDAGFEIKLENSLWRWKGVSGNTDGLLK
jgi:hypothetical protein